MRWLERYLVEGLATLQHFAEITASLVWTRIVATDRRMGASHAWC